tara:strand:+ start:1774 stop:2409 length:636 start_codon:yes stop_codon:yes gene_type:complete
MKIVKILIPILVVAIAISWDWPWSKKNENINSKNIKLPIGNHSLLYDYSSLIWKGQKAIGGFHTGNLDLKSGEIKIDVEGGVSGIIIIDMNTISCTDLQGEWKSKLEGHLKNEDFFSIDEFPESKIEFQSVKRIKNLIEFKGSLTIKNISIPISFTANLRKSDSVVLANCNLNFDRSKFDIKYGSGTFFKNLGDNLILDDINIDVTLAINN